MDKHNGFDRYLLETPVNEVYANMLLKVKREILLALAKKTARPEVLESYSSFTIPEEEADWHGLRIQEAREKQWYIESLERDRRMVPKKHEYRKELHGMLKAGYLDDLDPKLLYEEQDSRGLWKKIKDKF